MTTTPATTRTITLRAAKHAVDWLGRCERSVRVVEQGACSITLELDDAALRDLINDSLYYAEEMGPDNTDDVDYRPAARRCLVALTSAGLSWRRRSDFMVELRD